MVQCGIVVSNYQGWCYNKENILEDIDNCKILQCITSVLHLAE